MQFLIILLAAFSICLAFRTNIQVELEGQVPRSDGQALQRSLTWAQADKRMTSLFEQHAQAAVGAQQTQTESMSELKPWNRETLESWENRSLENKLRRKSTWEMLQPGRAYNAASAIQST